ncbi:hypothetical protein AF332_13435 [Sporosarcina globispora]|uniref:Glycine zipper-like domain-containing protein n=1 Tax=Sporosarcina globispora TaxID=1459 RepID=A0A0M0GE78_SPOGL|nr:hypothetical protein AF332_13435 [Sporosarcina globispora]
MKLMFFWIVYKAKHKEAVKILSKKSWSFSGSRMAFGLALGVVFGMIFKNWALGIAMGVVLGCRVDPLRKDGGLQNEHSIRTRHKRQLGRSH